MAELRILFIMSVARALGGTPLRGGAFFGVRRDWFWADLVGEFSELAISTSRRSMLKD